MKKFTAFVFCGALLGACNGDDEVSTRKGEVDDGALASGVNVTINGNTGSVDLPFSVAVPNVSDSDLEDELDGAVALTVTSNMSGASADLAAGTLVESNPAAPGEYSWTLSDDRLTATLDFFNETPGGLTLKTDRTYNAQLAVTENLYVKILSATGFTASPVGG